MLPLQHLIEDFTLARAALMLWPHDTDTLDDLLPQFRISANAIYPFASNGDIYLLRLAPVCEKEEQALRRELAFTAYLRKNEFPALAFIPSRRGLLLETLQHEGTAYYAMVSRKVPGTRMDWLSPMRPDIARVYGLTLARLHSLSSQFPDGADGSDCYTALDWAAQAIARYDGSTNVLAAIPGIRSALLDIPATRETFGLVHTDYELDNVFYDETSNTCHVIDFEGCLRHFFAYDLVISLQHMQEELDPTVFPACKDAFLDGYAAQRPLDRALLSAPALRQYGAVIRYARMLHATHNPPAEKPDWMASLYDNLLLNMDALAGDFA